jgi:hypothetical protein
MPCRPSAPIFGQSWRGKLSLRSISAASGAISAAAKRWTVSRSASATSPRPKFICGVERGLMPARLVMQVRPAML